MLVLTKAVLNSLPWYYLSLFKIPKAVANKIIQMQRKFLWIGNKTGHFRPPVCWEVVQKPKELGGFGVGGILIKIASSCLNDGGGLLMKKTPFGVSSSVQYTIRIVTSYFLIP